MSSSLVTCRLWSKTSSPFGWDKRSFSDEEGLACWAITFSSLSATPPLEEVSPGLVLPALNWDNR